MLTRIYMDANAGRPVLPEVRDAMISALDAAANPSSIHAEGRQARALVEKARADVAEAVGARPENVIFTSGATEAAALALTPSMNTGQARVGLDHLLMGATEHPCVLAGGRFSEGAVSRLPVERSGVLDLSALDEALAASTDRGSVPFVAVMLANNETGVIHPVREAARRVKARGGYVFCDAVQALGRMPVDIGELGVDFLALSAHKLGGPQGAGALVLADGDVRPAPLLTGGGQERRRRAGTENVTAIVGFGVAARHAAAHLTDMARLSALRAKLETELLAVSPGARIIGREADRLANTTMFAVPSLSAETLVIAFDLEGIAVSAGSACSSGKITASHVLEAMGEPSEIARSGVRVSLTPDATESDVHAFALAWRGIHARMRQSRAA